MLCEFMQSVGLCSLSSLDFAGCIWTYREGHTAYCKPNFCTVMSIHPQKVCTCPNIGNPFPVLLQIPQCVCLCMTVCPISTPHYTVSCASCEMCSASLYLPDREKLNSICASERLTRIPVISEYESMVTMSSGS